MSKFLKIAVIGLLMASGQVQAIFDPIHTSEVMKKWFTEGTFRELDQSDGFYVWIRALADGLGIKISIFSYHFCWPVARSASIAQSCMTYIDETCEDSAVIVILEHLLHRSFFNKDFEILNVIQNDLIALRLYQLAHKTAKSTVKSAQSVVA